MRRPSSTTTEVPAILALTLAILAILALPGASRAAAHSLRATDSARLHMISAKGETLYETGRARGTMPGTIRVHMHIGSSFHGTFAIHTRGGTIRGHGHAGAHGSGVWESFAGTLFVTGGSGRYRHAHGSAGLHGTFNRSTYALTIKTSGTLRY